MMWRKKHFKFVKRINYLSGFTLIELMIVVAVISILAVIAMPKFGRMVQKAREGSTKGNLGALRSAINIYYAGNDGFFPQQERLLDTDGGFGPNQYESSWTPGAVAPDMGVGHFIPTMVPDYIGEIPEAKIGQPWMGVPAFNKEGTGMVGTFQSAKVALAQLVNRSDSSWLWEVWIYDASAGVIWANANGVGALAGKPMLDTSREPLPITSW